MGDFVAQVRGFTPVIDAVVDDVGLVAAAVYGAVWRYCQMQDGVCRASLETVAARVGVNRWTALRHIKALCDAGYLQDLTPDEKGRPHTYADTGKARIQGVVEGRRSGRESPPVERPEEPLAESQQGGGRESTPGVAQSQRRGGRKSTVGVAESHPKIPTKRLLKKPPEETTEDTHGADAPSVPSEEADELATYFEETSGIERPPRATIREMAAADRLWYRPLAEILELAGSQGAAEDLVQRALQLLREKGCIVKAPSSILGTARALEGQTRRQSDRRRYVKGRYGHRVKS